LICDALLCFNKRMPITVRWEGLAFECGSPSEAVDLGRQLVGASSLEKPSARESSKSPADKTPGPEAVALTEDQSMERFLSALKPNQRNFLAALAPHSDGIKGDELAQEIGLESRQFGALVGAVSKYAKRSGIKVNQLLLSEMRFDGPRRYRFFKPKLLLQRHAGKIGAQPELRLAG
jgi:hypothetical protein